jgi:hypothetical protein
MHLPIEEIHLSIVRSSMVSINADMMVIWRPMRSSYELSQNRPETGTIILLFQPAEEDGGAQKCSLTKFASLKPDYVLLCTTYQDFQKSNCSKNDTFTRR